MPQLQTGKIKTVSYSGGLNNHYSGYYNGHNKLHQYAFKNKTEDNLGMKYHWPTTNFEHTHKLQRCQLLSETEYMKSNDNVAIFLCVNIS